MLKKPMEAPHAGLIRSHHMRCFHGYDECRKRSVRTAAHAVARLIPSVGDREITPLQARDPRKAALAYGFEYREFPDLGDPKFLLGGAGPKIAGLIDRLAYPILSPSPMNSCLR